MTAAVLLAVAADAQTAQRYADVLDGEPVLARLVRQLRERGVAEITVLATAAAAPVVDDLGLGVRVEERPGRAPDAGLDGAGPCLTAPADVVLHGRLLDMLLGGGPTALVLPPDRPGPPVRVEYGRIVAGESGAGLRTDAEVRVSGQGPARAVDVRGFVCERVRAPDDVARIAGLLAAADEDDLWLAAAVKADDSPVATYAVSSWSRYVARWCARRGIAPTTVTVLSLALGAGAGAAYAAGGRGWLALGSVLLLLAFALDCVDGQIARYTRRFSRFGGWLDAIGDRLKEYGALAGLAAGWAAESAWLFATTAVVLQTCRHLADFAYAEARRARGGTPLGGMAAGGPGRLQWVRRVVVLPIGERFVLIAVTAVIGGPALTFPVLVTWSALATAYMVAGRVLRSVGGARGRRASRPAGDPAGPLRDDGVLVAAAGWLRSGGSRGRNGILPVMRVLGPLDWLAVPLLRAVEYAVVAGTGRAAGVSWPWIYAAVVVLAMHHYDLVYRLRQGRPVPRWRTLATLGWDGRLVLVLVCAVVGGLTVVIPALAIGVGVVLVAESSLTWSGSAPSDETALAEVAA